MPGRAFRVIWLQLKRHSQTAPGLATRERIVSTGWSIDSISACSAGRKRFTLNRPAPFRYNVAGAQHEAVIIDVTETGIAIEGVQALPNGITVPVEFKLPAMLSPISTVAEVVWRNDRRAGLRFLQLQPQQQRQLERWLQHSRQGMTTGYSYASGY